MVTKDSKTQTIKTINLDEIRIDGGTQMRVKLNDETVSEYAELYQDGKELPPVKVVYDGTDYYLWEGFHRYHARRQAGLGTIPAEVTTGTKRDAVLLACGANSEHGLRRSNGDKRKAVETLLKDKQWGKWSDNKIADMACVAQQTVSRIRGELTQSVNSNTTRIGKDGKSYPAKKPSAKPSPKPAAPSPQEQVRDFFKDDDDPEPEPEPVREYKDTFDVDTIEAGKKPGPATQEISPAKVSDQLRRDHFSPLVRGIDRLAEINGGKGEYHTAANGALNDFSAALKEMRGGKQ